jgi:hypothetical protein
MDIKLLPAQEEFIYMKHDLPLDVAVYQGGFGSGKTFAGSLLGLMLCLKYPGIRGLVGSQNIPTVRDTTIGIGWKGHLRDLGLKPGIDFKHNITDGNIQFNNGPNGFDDGSCIYIRHFEEPDKLRSLEVGFIEIEEMSFINESTFLELLGRLRQTVLSNRQPLVTRRLFGHTNPESAKGWMYKHFVSKSPGSTSYKDKMVPYETAKLDGQLVKGNYRTISQVKTEEVEGVAVNMMYRLVIAPTTQNYFLPTSYIAGMKASFDQEYYKVNVMGEFGDYTVGLVTKGFDRECQVKPRLDIDPDLPLHLTCDFNVDPMCWAIAQRTKYQVNFIDEICLEGGKNIADTAREFMRRYPAGSFPYIVLNGDASGNSRHVMSVKSNATYYDTLEDELTRRGYQVSRHLNRKNPEVFERVQAWNAMIRNVNGEHAIFISERCEQLLMNIENLKWKVGTSDIEKPTPGQLKQQHSLKYLGHIFDAASYLVHYYYPLRQEVLRKPEMYQNRDVDSRFQILGLG